MMKERISPMIWSLKNVMALLLFVTFISCENTEYKDVWEDRYVESKLDTIEVKNNWFLTDRMTCSVENIENGKGFKALNLFLDGENLYVANQKGKSVDVFDVKTMKYKHSLEHNGRTQAHDVYVSGEQVFVATGNMCAIQIFDKESGTYLTRLGTGSYLGNVSKSGCVAANDEFVFVRDSKDQNIRVFDRRSISENQTDNNTVFASLDTKGYYISSSLEPLNASYDMEIIGDSLYAFIYQAEIMYAYPLKEIRTSKNQTPAIKTTLPGGIKVYAAVANEPHNTIWISAEINGKKQLMEVNKEDFHARRFNNPIRSFTNNERYKLSEQLMIAFYEESLLFTSENTVAQWKIDNNPSYIIEELK